MEQILKRYVLKVYPILEIFGDNIFSMICFSLRLELVQIAHLISMGTKFRLDYNGIEKNSIFREKMEQDIKNGLLHIEDCTFLSVGDDMSPQIVDESTIPKTNSEEIRLERLHYLPVALEKLKSEYPHCLMNFR